MRERTERARRRAWESPATRIREPLRRSEASERVSFWKPHERAGLDRDQDQDGGSWDDQKTSWMEERQEMGERTGGEDEGRGTRRREMEGK